jgi:hypothetical protein
MTSLMHKAPSVKTARKPKTTRKAALWGDETDADRWALGPEPAPGELWPAWTDADVWTITEPDPDPDPEPYAPTADDLAELAELAAAATARDFLDASERLTLADLAEHQAAFYRRWHNGAGDLFGRIMEDLAQKIRYVSAETPADFEAREETIDRDARQTWEEVGFRAGRDTCPCHALTDHTFGHHA